MGKPFGNGMPLAAVVTTKEVSDAFHNGLVPWLASLVGGLWMWRLFGLLLLWLSAHFAGTSTTNTLSPWSWTPLCANN